MVDNKDDNARRDGHAAYKEDIRDGSLLPEEHNPVSYTHLTLPTILLV